MKKFAHKNKFLISIFLVFILLTIFYVKVVEKSVSRYNGITIVLDAGHGGRDGGSVGINGTIEKEINLEYVLLLKKKLVESGYRVELTRKNDDGLYSALDKNKKLSDMNARFNIIKKVNPNLVVSIHMNSYINENATGAFTYYRKDDEASKICADLIQKSLSTYCGVKQQVGKVGDFYMLNCSYYTSVLVECGFLSNSKEEKLLNSADYKNKVTDAIFNGILLYFGNNNI